MTLLARNVGPLTLHGKLGSDGVVDSYASTLHHGGTEPVITHRLARWLHTEPARLSAVERRIGDLLAARNPSLVRWLDYVREDDRHYIVEEIPGGIRLSALLEALDGRPLPPRVGLLLAANLCRAVDALHAIRGAITGIEHVLHLGLRPHAVHVLPDGAIRIGDFGLVRLRTDVPRSAFRGPVSEVAAWLAPEQVGAPGATSRRTDLFTTGSLIVTLLTGRVTFAAPAELIAVHRIRVADVGSALAEVAAAVPGADEILAPMLALAPSQRPPHARDIRAALAGLIDDQEDARAQLRDLVLQQGVTVPPQDERPADDLFVDARRSTPRR